MKLEELKAAQMKEILHWAERLDKVLTPDKITPVKIKEYPLAIETSERLKRICQWQAKIIKDKIQLEEDIEMDQIESQVFVFKTNMGGMPEYKKKFTNAEQRGRELRRRLADNETYQELQSELAQWDIMASDWVSHVNKLRRELSLLEIDYTSNGGQEYNNAGSVNPHRNRK